MPVFALFVITLLPASVTDPWKTWMPKRPNPAPGSVPLPSIVVPPMKAEAPMATWMPTEPLLLTLVAPDPTPFRSPIRALPALEIRIPVEAFDVIVLKTIVAFPPSTEMPCRSEEHTSELQSLAYLVCRLLLEKKKRDVIAHASLT